MTVPPTLQLTRAEFKKMQELVYRHAGISIGDEKVAMLSNRLRKRLRVLRFSSFKEYCDLVASGGSDHEEFSHFLSAVSTNETYFFRNEQLWDYVGTGLVEYLCAVKQGSTPRRAAIWSAASSTGAEAYTLLIVLKEKLPDFSKWRIQICGTDISHQVLETARKGVYAEYAVRNLCDRRRRRYFTHNEQDNTYELASDIRRMVDFSFHNLRDPFKRSYFDVVFLRNVMMYFDYDMKRKVLENVLTAMRPGALLITGDVDPLRDGSDLRERSGLEPVRSNTYRKPTTAARSAAARNHDVERMTHSGTIR